MANALKGDVGAVIAGQQFVLRMDMNAMCELEAELGEPAAGVLGRMAAPQAFMRDIRAILWASLRRHHSGVTIEGAGDLLHEDGAGARAAILSALSASAPPSGDDAEKKATAATARP